jgi:lipoprotein NlpD
MRRIAFLLAVALAVSGCAMTRKPAPVDDRRPPRTAAKPPAAQPAPPAAPSAAGTYVVRRGDTLYSIALEHGVDYRELARWNGLDDPTKIRVGQTLRVEGPGEKPAPVAAAPRVEVGAARGAGAVESRPLEAAPAAPGGPAGSPGDAGVKTSPKALRLPYSEQNVAMLSKGEAAPSPKPAPQAAALSPKPEPQPPVERDPDAIEFIWPAKGRVIATFSEPRNKGVDIAGRIGDPVVAAAPGRVIYVGSGIPGLGKFIVIKHDNGFNSVYAHNREILVRMDQSVARGQRIAELGDSDTDSPKLHFEIRKLGKPVDPQRYLPPS